jgi:hypothetical protein
MKNAKTSAISFSLFSFRLQLPDITYFREKNLELKALYVSIDSLGQLSYEHPQQ